MTFAASTTTKPILLFLVAQDWYFISHRWALGQAALAAGYKVVVATCVGNNQQQLEQAGFCVIPLKYFNRTGLNVLKELRCLFELWCIYRRVRPSLVHHVALKAVMYGSFIAFLNRVPRVINAITGLGYVFINRGLQTRLLRLLICTVMRPWLWRRNNILIVQNEDDLAFVHQNFKVSQENLKLIRGAGIDLDDYAYSPEPDVSVQNPPVVVLAARMIQDKGIFEVIEAIRLLRQQTSISARFVFCGQPDDQNPLSIKVTDLEAWQSEGLIEWRGHVENMAEIYQKCHLAILCSYREGTPKSLLEAAACGRAILTTDVPGCRQVIEDQWSGLLVPVQNSQAIFQALKILLTQPVRRAEMGQRGRQLMKEEFSSKKIIDQTLALYDYKDPYVD